MDDHEFDCNAGSGLYADPYAAGRRLPRAACLLFAVKTTWAYGLQTPARSVYVRYLRWAFVN